MQLYHKAPVLINDCGRVEQPLYEAAERDEIKWMFTARTSITKEVESRLRDFIDRTDFCRHGGIITDLDGTAFHEDRGRIFIPDQVQHGLKRLCDLGRPLVINSSRFPLSVIRTFGKDWYTTSRAPIPCVTLNGSLLGYVVQREDQLVFEEISAVPLSTEEIDCALAKVRALVDANLKDILLFYYPRDWRMGEIIWTPIPEDVIEVKEKFVSSSSVTAVELSKLRDQLQSEDICMMFLHVNIPEEQLMAYQHAQRANFFTHKGTDKPSGARAMAAHLGFSLAESVGAGDTEMDQFLNEVGLAMVVGPLDLNVRGLTDTLRLKDSFRLGEALLGLAAMLEGREADHRSRD